MFGMSSKEFWEDDPSLYWAYRTFYLKKYEMDMKDRLEFIKYEAWLNGNTTSIAVSVALNNMFSKQTAQFPSYDELYKDFENEDNIKHKTKKEVDKEVQAEFNAWAR